MSEKKGYTLAELLVTAVILAVLAGIAIPNFTKSRNKAQANQAIAYLRTIRTSQRMYFAKNGEYACQAAGSCNTVAKIKDILGAEVAMGKYIFEVTATPTTFTGRASFFTVTGPSGAGVTTDITLNQDGSWGGSYSPLPPAD